jgi:hypothetical protein
MVGSQGSQPGLEVRQHHPFLCMPVWPGLGRSEGAPALRLLLRNCHFVRTDSPKGVHGGVVRDAENPRPEVTASVERLEPSKRLEKRVLRQFRGHGGLTDQTRNQAIYGALVSIQERSIGALPARQRIADKLVVSHCLVCGTMLRLLMCAIC